MAWTIEGLERKLQNDRKLCFLVQEAFNKALNTHERRRIARAIGVPDSGNPSPRFWGKPYDAATGKFGKYDQPDRARTLRRAVTQLTELQLRTVVVLAEGAMAKGVIQGAWELEHGAIGGDPEPEPKAPEPDEPNEPVVIEGMPAIDLGEVDESQSKVWDALGITRAVGTALQQLVPHLTEQVRKGVRVVEHVVPSPKGIVKITDAVHEAFEECLNVLRLPNEFATSRWLWMYGPAGTGKTHMARQMAEALDLRFAASSCSPGSSASELFGWLLPTGENGVFKYHPATFIDFVKHGGLFLLDEFANLPPDAAVQLNQMLANLEIWISKALDDPHFKVHPDFRLVVADNTRGVGSRDGYVRNQQDSATRNRFQFRRIGYDRVLEETLYGADKAWLEACWQMRERTAELGIREEVGSRQIAFGAHMRSCYGKDRYPIETCKSLVTEGWLDDDRAKLGITPFKYS